MPVRRTRAWAPTAAIEHRELHGVERILHHEAQFGVAFHRQPPAEEQRIGVFTPLRQQHEIMRDGADGEVRRLAAAQRAEALPFPAEIEGEPRVAHVDAHLLVQQQRAHVFGQARCQADVQGGGEQSRAGIRRQPCQQRTEGPRDGPGGGRGVHGNQPWALRPRGGER
jgi:hypothetical protein